MSSAPKCTEHVVMYDQIHREAKQSMLEKVFTYWDQRKCRALVESKNAYTIIINDKIILVSKM